MLGLAGVAFCAKASDRINMDKIKIRQKTREIYFFIIAIFHQAILKQNAVITFKCLKTC